MSRFAHYLKVAARDKIGSFAEAGECEEYLHHWLQQYVTADSDAARRGQGQVSAARGQRAGAREPRQAGSYLCVAHLWPHFELDEADHGVEDHHRIDRQRNESTRL